MNDLALDIDFLINNAEIREAVRKARRDIQGLADDSQKDVDKMDKAFKRLSLTLAGVFSANAAKDFVMQLINVRGEFQQLEIAFTTILQSKEKADALMSDVVTLSSKTPFSLKDAASGAKQLLAYGTASESVVETLTMLGNVASGVSAPLNDIVYLYGTLQASGRVTQMDINQFAGRGIPIYKALADVMGKSTSEIKDLVSAGKVGFPEIQAAFERMTGSAGQFYNLMEAQSKSLTGQISNLGDAWDQMLNDIGKSNEGLLSGGIAAIASMVENYQKIIDVLTVLIATYGVYRAALIANTLAVSGMTIVELLHYGALVLAEKAQRLLNITSLANPYVAVATALGALVATLIVFSDKVDNAVKSQENLNSIKETATKITIEQKQRLQDLIKTANNEVLSLKEREAALRKINQTSPEFLGALTLAKLKTEEGRKAIDEYNRSIDMMALKQASFDKRVEIQKQKVDLLAGKAEDKIGYWDKVKANLKSGKSGSFNNTEYEKVRQQQAKDFDKQLKDIDAYENNEIAKYNAKKPKDIKTVIKRTVGIIDEEIKNLKQAQENVSTKEEYAKLQAQINQLEAEKALITGKVNKAEKKQADERLEFLQKLFDKEAEVKRMGVEKDESEILKAQKVYEDLRKRADKLKLGAGVKQRINNAEEKEVGFLKYDQQTNVIKNSIEKQKQLYADFEEYKKTFGETKAKERFAGQIDTEKTYLQQLQNLLREFEGKKNLTTGEDERKKILAKEIEDATLLVQQNRDKEYAEAYDAAKTYQQKELDIKRDHVKKLDTLLKEQNGKVTKEQRENLERSRDEAIEAAKSEALAKTEAYKLASEDIFDLTRTQVKAEMKALKQLINDGSITGVAKEKVQSEINKLEFTLKIGVDKTRLKSLKDQLSNLINQLNATDETGVSIVGKKDFTRLKKQISEIKEEIRGLENPTKKITEVISDNLARISGSFNELSQAFGGADTKAGYLMGTIGELTKVGSDAAGAFASFASGDIIGGITKTISAVAGLFSIGKKVKEMNEKARQEVADFYANAISGEKAYQELLKERALQTVRDNKTALNGIGAELKLRQSQLSDWKKESDEIMRKLQGMSFTASEEYKHGTWFRKAQVIKTYGSLAGMSFEQLSQLLAQGRLEGDAKALVERLKELEQKGFDATQAMAALADEVNQLFTGTTADALTDSLLNMFKEGKTGFQDMADFFESSMQDAALSIFRNKVLAEAMETFYKDFAEASKGGLTADKIAELKSLFTSLMGGVTTEFENLQAVTGLKIGQSSKSSSKSSSIQASIAEKITEETASEMTGLLRSSYEMYKQHLNVSKASQQIFRDQLLAQYAIQENTGNTVNELKNAVLELKEINKNTKIQGGRATS